MKTVLSIAGFDPTGLAGVVADTAVFRDRGLHGLGAVTALTVQGPAAVHAVSAVEAGFLEKELETLSRAFTIEAVKTGMLATAENVRVAARFIRNLAAGNVVIDPVLRATSGAALLEEGGLAVLAEELLPLATVVTPNIDEARALTGLEISSVVDMEVAARRIKNLGPEAVLVKGGHLEGEPVDVLYDGRDFFRIEGKRIEAEAGVLHGTGCILSSAIASGLATGKDLHGAIKEAKAYLEKTVRERKGAGGQG